MRRREFLLTAAAGLGAAGMSPPRAQRADARALERIAMMTLNFTTLLKTPGQPQGPDRTLDFFDLPQMYVDTYGVHNVELQHYHMASTDPAYFQTLKARLDRAACKATQLVVEFGALNINAPDHNFLPRIQVVDLTKVWIDRCAMLDCPRIMVNQGQPTAENRAMSIETLSAMAAYGKTKNVKVTMETRGPSTALRAGGAGTAPVPAEPAWVLLNDIARSAGAYINIDLGGIGAASQDDLHTALKALLPNSSGSMHVRTSMNWDLATAIRFIEGQGYAGLYSIEAPGHERTRAIYNTILEALL